MKSIDATTLANLQSDTPRPIYLIKIEYDSGTVFAHTRTGQIVFNGDTYFGVGNLGKISDLQESSELQASNVTMALSGVNQANIRLALAEHYQGRPCTIYMGAVEEDLLTLEGIPFQVFKGRIDNQVIQSGKLGSIVLKIENVLSDWKRTAALRYNNESQQRLYPGDRFFEFTEQAVERRIDWGKESAV